MKTTSFILPRLLICAVFAPVSSMALDIYVSTAGDDANTGEKNAPLASLAAAQEKAKAVAGKESVTIEVADGIYYLPETLVFTSEDSGVEGAAITYKAENEGGAVLSGGSQLALSWTEYENGIFKAKTPVGLAIDQVFINGENQRMARYPNYDATKKDSPYQGFSNDAFSAERAKRWANPIGGYIHALHSSRWGGYHYQITGKDDQGAVTFEGGWQNNRQMGMHKDYRMVENIFEELDAPGEWFHDASKNTLYYMPEKGTDLTSARVEVVRLRHLIEFQGSEEAPVKHITLSGFTVRHAARTFMDCKEQLLRSDWAIYRGGAYLLTGTENIQILNSEFDQVGGNAIFVNMYNRNVLIKGCHIHDTGASGVCFVGDPKAVRDPLFEYHETQDLSEVDRTVGPKTNNYPAESIVEDCLIHGIGRVEKQPAGIQISMASGITVRDLSIYDCARSGINISEGTWGGHLIEGCDVFDTVLETHDHGSFNSWGRDRFWDADREATQKIYDQEPNFPFLDAMEVTTIRNSRWRCDHGWDIDLDDGSTNYDIYNNLMLNSGLKLREGFRRHAWNNITVNNGFHPHVWYQGSKDQVYSNIFMARHRAARITGDFTRDGTMVDKNFYTIAKEDQNPSMKKTGWDKNSIYGKVEFVNPKTGDYTVKEGSQAFDTGFKNFAMDQFGVKKPSLKAIARTPEIPELGKVQAKIRGKGKVNKATILGSQFRNLQGQEFSAYGVSAEEAGALVVKVAPNTPFAKAGLVTSDIIQAVNGKKTTNTKALKKVLSSKTGEVTLKIVRNQATKEIKLTL